MQRKDDKQKKQNRAVSITKLIQKVFVTMAFTGQWLASFGLPEMSGVWIIWGNSANGKTRFALMLAKYLTLFGKVIYNSLEEGARQSMKRAMIDTGMAEVSKRFTLLHREPMDELKVRLRNRKSANIVFIDSLQYTGMSRKEYIALKEEFPNKLFIFISHAEGKQPAGKLAKFIRYDADQKLHTEGFKVFGNGRFGGGDPFVISKEKSDQYWKTAS